MTNDTLAHYPIALLVDVLDRVVDDAVMRALRGAGFHDLTRAHGVVFEMLDPAGSRVTDLAYRARITKQAMGQLVSAVESLGYLERSPDPSDRRAQLVRMTPLGERAAAAAVAGLGELEAAWRSELGDRRHEQARRSLAALVRATGMDHVR